MDPGEQEGPTFHREKPGAEKLVQRRRKTTKQQNLCCDSSEPPEAILVT